MRNVRALLAVKAPHRLHPALKQETMTEKEINEMIEDARSIAADPKPGLAEMISAVAGEANRTEGSQRAMLLGELRTKVDHEAMRRVVCLDAVHSFLTACVERPNDVATRLKKMVQR